MSLPTILPTALIVISWPGSWADSQPKPASKSQARPGPRAWLVVACGPGFNFGRPFSLALSQALIFSGQGHVAFGFSRKPQAIFFSLRSLFFSAIIPLFSAVVPAYSAIIPYLLPCFVLPPFVTFNYVFSTYPQDTANSKIDFGKCR